jgi:predicted TIM-barrel fold metal-dependent hydrolase
VNWIDANTWFGAWPHRDLNVPPGKLVKILRAAGTSRALTLSLAGPKLSADEGNEETLRACTEHSELIPVAVIDPRKFTMTGAAMAARDRGFAAVRLANGMLGFPLDISPVEEIVSDCAANHLPVFVDVAGWGDATACERLANDAGARIVMIGVRYATLSEAVVSMKRAPGLYLEISKLNTPDAIRAAADEVGAERMLFGSGAPFNYARCARDVAEHNNLNDDELEQVASKTVLSLIGEGD